MVEIGYDIDMSRVPSEGGCSVTIELFGTPINKDGSQ